MYNNFGIFIFGAPIKIFRYATDRMSFLKDPGVTKKRSSSRGSIPYGNDPPHPRGRVSTSFLCNCLEFVTVSDWQCNFEPSGSFQTCGIEQDTNDKFDWTSGKGATPSGSTGPSGDHTSGSGW